MPQGPLGPVPQADWHVEVRGEEGSRHIWAWAPGRGEFQVSTAYDGDDHSMPKLESLRLSWRADDGVASVVMAGEFQGIAADQTRVVAVPVLGQSTSNGNIAASVITGTAPAPTRAFMPRRGVRLLGNDHMPRMRLVRALDEDFLDFPPAAEQVTGGSGETGWVAAAWRLTAAGGLASTDAVVVATGGIGSQGSEGVAQGTPPYDNIMRFLRRARHVAGLSGRDFACPAVFHPWHEGNVARDAATTASDLLAHQADYTADINAITGASGQVLLVTDALASFRHYGFGLGLPQGVLNAAKAHPDKILYACPRYFLEHLSDDVHLSAAGAALRGEYFARALARALQGQDALPVHMLSAVRSGATITVNFHKWPDAGALRFNTARVSDPGNHGVEFLQTGGNSVTISSLAWADDDTLTITLSATPTGTAQKVRIAGQEIADTGPTAGPRSTICDNATGTTLHGQDMPNYAVPQEIEVTT